MTIQQRILTALIFLPLAACNSGDTPPSPANQDQFVEVYVDLLRSSPADTSGMRSESAQRILASHGFTPEEFQAAVQYYNADPARWKQVLDEVVRRLEEGQQSAVDPHKNGSAATSGSK